MMKNFIPGIKIFFSVVLVMALVAGCATSKKAAKESFAASEQVKKLDDKNGMKAYSKVITDKAETDEGLFDVHKVDDKFYYEIPDSLLEREMLVVSRIAKTADNMAMAAKKITPRLLDGSAKVIRYFCATSPIRTLPTLPSRFTRQ